MLPRHSELPTVLSPSPKSSYVSAPFKPHFIPEVLPEHPSHGCSFHSEPQGLYCPALHSCAPVLSLTSMLTAQGASSECSIVQHKGIVRFCQFTPLHLPKRKQTQSDEETCLGSCNWLGPDYLPHSKTPLTPQTPARPAPRGPQPMFSSE